MRWVKHDQVNHECRELILIGTLLFLDMRVIRQIPVSSYRLRRLWLGCIFSLSPPLSISRRCSTRMKYLYSPQRLSSTTTLANAHAKSRLSSFIIPLSGRTLPAVQQSQTSIGSHVAIQRLPGAFAVAGRRPYIRLHYHWRFVKMTRK